MNRFLAIALRIAAVLSIGIVFHEANAGYPSPPAERVDEPEYWLNHSVVFATVTDVHPIIHAFHHHQLILNDVAILKLHPEATLSGSFDAAQEPEISANMEIGMTSAIRKAPAINSKVIVVLEHYGTRYHISQGTATFMPGRRPLIEVSSFSDWNVQQTLLALQKLRSEIARRTKWGIQPYGKLTHAGMTIFLPKPISQEQPADTGSFELEVAPFHVHRLQTGLLPDGRDDDARESDTRPPRYSPTTTEAPQQETDDSLSD